MITLTRNKMQQQIRGRPGPCTLPLRHDGAHAQFVWGPFPAGQADGHRRPGLCHPALLVPKGRRGVRHDVAFGVPEPEQAMEQFVYHNSSPPPARCSSEYIERLRGQRATNTTAVGIGALIVVALMLISAIDKNLNYVWRSTWPAAGPVCICHVLDDPGGPCAHRGHRHSSQYPLPRAVRRQPVYSSKGLRSPPFLLRAHLPADSYRGANRRAADPRLIGAW